MSSWKPPPLVQPENGYRFAIDAFLIAAFAARFQPSRWLDLGTGSAPIAWFLHHHLPHAHGVAVERQAQLAACARRNLAHSSVLLIEGDLRDVPWREACFDLVVCNPPFFPAGSGRISPEPTKAAAHHGLFGDVVDFASSVHKALQPQGVLCCILRLPDTQKLQRQLKRKGWQLQRSVQVVTRNGNPPSRLLCAFTLRESLVPIEQAETLYLQDEQRADTDALVRWLEPPFKLWSHETSADW